MLADLRSLFSRLSIRFRAEGGELPAVAYLAVRGVEWAVYLRRRQALAAERLGFRLIAVRPADFVA